MEINTLRAQMKAKLAEAKELHARYTADPAVPITKEQSDQIASLFGQYDSLKAQVDVLEKFNTEEAYLREPAPLKSSADPVNWRPSAPLEGDTAIDEKGWNEFTIKTLEVHPALGMVTTDRKFRYFIPLAVQSKDYPSAFEAYLRKGYGNMGPNDKKTLSGGIDSAGGFTIPPDFQANVIRKIATMATVRANARVVQTSRQVLQYPKISYTTDDEYTSGVRLTWTGETPASASVHRVTDPVFGLISIPVHTAMASMPMTNDLLEDAAFDLGGLAEDLFAEAFALGENDAFWNGNGVSRPMGILTQVGGDGPASVNSGTASTLTADGLIDLIFAVPSQYEQNAKTYFNKATEKIIRKLKDLDNNYLWPIITQAGNLGVHPRELLGFPTVRDEFIPDVAANAYPIVHGDLRGYIVVDRVGLTVQRLDELYAETNIVLLLGRKRVGGQIAENYRMKVQKVAA